MLRLALLFSLLLTGCVTAPVKQVFPDVPKELLASCPDLKTIQPTTKLSDVVIVVIKNYSEYHECRIKHDVLIEWYNQQREIFNK